MVSFVALLLVALTRCQDVPRPPSTPTVTPAPPAEPLATSSHATSAAAASTPAATTAAAVDAAPAACPPEMILVEGDYCPRPKHVCRRWMDPPTSAYADFRCAEYAQPAVCQSPAREHRRFCIDREEYVREGEALPLADQSWTSAGRLCESLGKRLCLESEWNFACEGEEMRPYPYGFSRDATLCNIDQMHLGKPQSGLRDLRAPTSAYPGCVSPFGVHDMSGNVEEWATLDHGKAPDRSAMKGAWWLPGKNTCRAATLGHGEIYRGPQVGVRCCKDS